MLTQIQSLLDQGMTEDEIQAMFPEIDFTTALEQIASIQAFLNNRELELLLTSLIAELPEQPVKELKKLLEIYSELLSVNNSRVTDERILQLLEIWKNTANLKKVIVSINR